MNGNGTQYHHLYRDIIADIYIGKRKNGDMLPSQEELCAQYGVSRNTVRAALQKLEEQGYIRRKGKKQPVICFDWEDPILREKYCREIAGRAEAILQVYEFMEQVMPDLFVAVLQSFSEDQRKNAADMTGTLIQADLRTEQEMAMMLNRIYQDVLAMTGNRLLVSMFGSLYYFVQIPVERNKRKERNYQMSMWLVKYIFQKFQGMIRRENYRELHRMIAFFCHTARKNTAHYLDELCADIMTAEKESYEWVPEQSRNIGYILLAADLVWQIRAQEYQTGEILPSYAKLAALYCVSEKTSRRAIELLNQWGVVTTINGVGSRVDTFTEIRLDDTDRLAQEGKKVCQEVHQVLQLVMPPVLSRVREVAEMSKDTEVRALLKEEELLPEQVRKLLSAGGFPVAGTIFDQLYCLLKWGSLLEEGGQQKSFRIRNL